MSEENLLYWLDLHAIPRDFPLLSKGEVSSRVYLRENGNEIIRILDHMQASFRNMVVVPKGQGATTLLRELIERTVTAPVRVPTLHISIDLENFDDDEDISEVVSEAIVRGVFHHLVQNQWPEASSGAKRAKLLSFLGFETINDFRVFRGTLTLDQRVPESIMEYSENVEDLYKFLYEELGISVRLCFDFNHDCSQDLLLDVVREQKWFDENSKDKIVEAAVTETYFVTSEQADQISSTWSVSFQKYNVRPYSKAEIFGMLETKFDLEGHLITIFSDRFVNRIWEDGMPLHLFGTRLKAEMVDALDQLLRGEIPFYLEPKNGSYQ
ncbi:hypothetical protein [Roseobacter sp. A03A-229]